MADSQALHRACRMQIWQVLSIYHGTNLDMIAGNDEDFPYVESTIRYVGYRI